MCSGKLVSVRTGGSCLCNKLDIYINMRIGAGPCLVICSKARVCSKVKRRADWRDEPCYCPSLTLLHKLQGHETFSILLPNSRSLKSLIRKGKSLGRFLVRGEIL
jgi:hypothetical protein